MRIDTLAVVTAFATAAGITGGDVAVLFSCMAGVYSSFSFRDPPMTPRSRMWKFGCASVFIGWAFTILVNAVIMYLLPGFKMLVSVQAALGGIVSFISPFLMEWIVKMVRTGDWIRYIPFIRNRGE
jgi:hypothetical protein